uniref:HDC02927 n=1 Tax=Drosophila melanogaster TaxID=7227 RepID=Q6IHA1_DROME|nr:TPA_inf: HDC02927 [Drosophila melanogaster]
MTIIERLEKGNCVENVGLPMAPNRIQIPPVPGYQKEQEAIRNINPPTINMFGHLSLLAALFFIGTLKVGNWQRELGVLNGCINRSGPNQNPGKVITSLVMCTCHCGICLINKNARVPAPRTMPLPLPPRLQLHLCGLWVLSGDPDQTPHPSVREPKKPCGCQSSFVFVICALMSYTFECVFACPSHCPS